MFKDCTLEQFYRIKLFFLLQLIPGYRGYTIDSLRKLSVLDDLRISADERHHFKGLARRRGKHRMLWYDYENIWCWIIESV